MEIVLAFVVVAAVIIFGALISMGNERQRRAIDDLREQIVLWAMQDLRIKRERFARDVRIDDPLDWLNRTVTKIWGYDLNLQAVEAYDEPQTLICTSEDGANRVAFALRSPGEIRQISHGRRNRLSKFADQNPLLSLPRGATAVEFSALNCGMLFDLELPIAWKRLAGQEVEHIERMWMYMIT